MSIIINITKNQTSKAADGYLIKNPIQVKTKFSVNSESEAATSLNIKDQTKTNEIKSFLKNYDMTNISTNELKKVGETLFNNHLINDNVYSSFIGGNMAFNDKGEQTDLDVRFNAVAMFNEILTDNDNFRSGSPQYAGQSSAMYAREGLVGVNQAINALAYFTSSSGENLSIHEKA